MPPFLVILTVLAVLAGIRASSARGTVSLPHHVDEGSLRGTSRRASIFGELQVQSSINITSVKTTSALVAERKLNDEVLIDVDDLFDLVEYRSVQYTVSLQVFLNDTPVLMDDHSMKTFTAVAFEFIVQNIDSIDIPVTALSSVTVVDQKLTWSRLAASGKSSTGLEVRFEADVTTVGDVARSQAEQAIQLLFDTKAQAFVWAFSEAMNEEEMARGPEPVATFSLTSEPMRVPLGLASSIAGCLGFIALVFVGTCYVIKEKSDEEEKDLSKTSVAEENSFPVQAIRNNQLWDIVDSDEELTFDDTIIDGIVKEQAKSACAIFECNESAIVAGAIENQTDSDDEYDFSDDDEKYEYSLMHRAENSLSEEELSNFDSEVRRAEC